ncbi:MAG: ATP-binding protein [Bifidobacteriaceae bacterium]|jgi:predicted AAA+ superfamily ATPase|nr:ATP-binding protein [Bifidobacteriaceae bacterium]
MSNLMERHLSGRAARALAYSPVLIIEGARQVGKSTLATMLAGSRSAATVTLDDAAVRAAIDDDRDGFVEHTVEDMLVIDEIQRLPELTLAIKAAVDRDRRPGRFLLTGSSSLLRVRGLADSLAGRAIRLRLWGFSQGEIEGRMDDFVTAVTSLPNEALTTFSSDLTRADYAERVTRGSYPIATALPERERRDWLDSYLDTLLRRDLPALRRGFDAARAIALLRVLAANQSGELVKARLASDIGMPVTTVTTYLDLLSDIGLFTTLRPWTPNLTSREIGRPKGLVADSGLAARLTRVTASRLQELSYAPAFGSLLEGFVAAELLKQRGWSGSEFELFHYRNRQGREVDLICELDDGRIIAIEVKAASSFQRSHVKNLAPLRDALGDRFLAGIVLGTGQRSAYLGRRLYGLPISALWKLGD